MGWAYTDSGRAEGAAPSAALPWGQGGQSVSPVIRGFGPACPLVDERPRGIRARSSVPGTRWVSEYHSPFQSRYHKTPVRRAGLFPEEAA